jgi:transposase
MKARRKQLEQLDKDTLIEGHLLLEGRVRVLEKQVNNLRQLLEEQVPKTPQNSSIPPSQSRKANQNDKPTARRGPPKGHVGTSRERSDPNEFIECRVTSCRQCGCDLSGLPQHIASRHQVVDLAPVRPLVREVLRYGRYCPDCGRYQRATAPAGFETGRKLGPHLEQWVLYLHYAHPLSYQRVQHILRAVTGLNLSIGTLVNIVARAQAALRQAASAIRQRLQAATVIGSDETGVRVAGTNQWQWVFQTTDLAYYVIRPSRSAQVIQDVLGTAQPEVWVSDGLSSQMCHPAVQYQLCLAHQVRELQYQIDNQNCEWAAAVQALFYRAMTLGKQRDHLSVAAYRQRVIRLNQQLDGQLKQYPEAVGSQPLWRRYHKHRRALLLFLERADVPPTNNASEQALRNTVIYRKVTGGFRSDWAAELYANLISVLETARRQQQPLFDTLAPILAPPTSHG